MKSIFISPIIGMIAVVLIGILAGSLILQEFQKYQKILEELQKPLIQKPGLEKPAEISEAEKVKIEAWIKENNLNKYGDPQGMMYTGGTPLFDEKTGKRIDRYDYILRNHPNRPWLQL